jgi:polyhydroxyalkanoate synthesis repressor PhaR
VSALEGERLVKRYANRKLYDPAARRYVTLEDLARTVAQGGELRVVDQESGEDITSVVLAQVILEGLKERTARIPRQVLTRIIRLGAAPKALRDAALPPQQAAARARDEAERIVSDLIRRGRLTLEEALALRQDIASSVHRIVSDAQHGIESRMRGLLDRTEREGGISPSLQTLRERLLSLETYLDSPSAKRPAKPAEEGRSGGRGARKKH